MNKMNKINKLIKKSTNEKSTNEKLTIKKFMTFRYTDLTAVCEYLEEMSEQGWELVSVRTLFEFRRSEPKRVRYAAELLETASAVSNAISDKSQDYIDMCEQAGWEFVCNAGKMYIFRTENEEAPDIVTDSADKLADIRRATLKTFFMNWFVLPVLFVFNLVMQLISNRSVARIATQYIAIASILFYLIFFVIVFTQIVGFVLWYVRAKHAVNTGKSIPYVGLDKLRKRKFEAIIPLSIIVLVLGAFTVAGAIHGDYFMAFYSLVITIIVALIVAVSYIINKLDISAAAVIALSVGLGFAVVIVVIVSIIAILFSRDSNYETVVKAESVYSQSGELILNERSMPLVINDFESEGERQDADKGNEVINSVYGNSTIFASEYSYNSHYSDMRENDGWLSYDVYHSKSDNLLNEYLRMVMKQYNDEQLTVADPENWRAQAAWKIEYVDQYVVRYDDCVVICNHIDSLFDESEADDNVEEIATVFAEVFNP
jgi:hypothetical protein